MSAGWELLSFAEGEMWVDASDTSWKPDTAFMMYLAYYGGRDPDDLLMDGLAAKKVKIRVRVDIMEIEERKPLNT